MEQERRDRAVLTLSSRTWNPFQVKSVSRMDPVAKRGNTNAAQAAAMSPLHFPLKNQDQG